MGKVGRHIDTFNDAERDRVIEGQGWGVQWAEIDDDGTCTKCLIGHKRGMGYADNTMRSLPEYGEFLDEKDSLIGIHMVKVFERFGISRIAKLLKMRAAKGNQKLVREIRDGIFTNLKSRVSEEMRVS